MTPAHADLVNAACEVTSIVCVALDLRRAVRDGGVTGKSPLSASWGLAYNLWFIESCATLGQPVTAVLAVVYVALYGAWLTLLFRGVVRRGHGGKDSQNDHK
jgi:hypothetical protein